MGFFRLALLFGLMAPVADATAAEERARALASEHGCTACHGMVRKQVGPGFAQIADRYRNDPAAPSQLAANIRNGSVGRWGRVIMPRQPRVTEEHARLLAQWVLSQPSPPP
jgi:cytochrome c